MKKVLAMAAAVASMFLASPAHAAGPFTYQNVSARQCLDVYKARTADDTPVQLYRCTGDTPQKWYRDEVEPGRYQLRTALGGNKCIDGFRGDNVQVTLWICTPSSTQYWERIPHSDGTVTYKNAAFGNLCLDAAGGTGPKAILWDCHFGPQQRFK